MINNLHKAYIFGNYELAKFLTKKAYQNGGYGLS